MRPSTADIQAFRRDGAVCLRGVLSPDELALADSEYELLDPATREKRDWVCHGHPCLIRTKAPVRERYIVRSPDPDYTAEAAGMPRNDRLPKSLRNQAE